VARVGCQLGHVPRTSGLTGTGGCCGETEQDYVKRLFNTLDPKLRAAGHTPIKILADPDGYPAMDVFVAFHCDGNNNTNARGCSFGYRKDLPNAAESKKFGDRWRAEHQNAGYPGGNRETNYTKALARYYALGPARLAGAKQAIAIEFGFLTNKADNDWLIDNVGKVANALVKTVVAFHGGTLPEEDLSIVDASTREYFDMQFKLLRLGDDPDPTSGNTHPFNLKLILDKINETAASVDQLQADMKRVKQKLGIP
jgi:N-acetylmuramoyl-L-alanine amidase